MAYTKPQVIAQNASAGSYAAGCPAEGMGPYVDSGCKACERTEQFVHKNRVSPAIQNKR